MTIFESLMAIGFGAVLFLVGRLLYEWKMERNRRQMAEYMAGPYLVKREEAWQRERAYRERAYMTIDGGEKIPISDVKISYL